jgi:phosphonatase-like hydrolase
MIKLAVLDMAGTTVDCTFAVHDCLVGAFADHKLFIDRDVASMSIAVPKPVGIRTILFEAFSMSDDELADAIHERFLDRMNRFYAEDEGVQPLPGTEQLFAFLKEQGIYIALDTGFSRPTADVIIQRLGWRNVIDFSVTSDEVEKGRPYADMILRAMDRFDIENPAEVIKAGDSPADMKQGKDAGCYLTIGVLSGAFSQKELKEAGADALVDRPDEIIEIIVNHGKYV